MSDAMMANLAMPGDPSASAPALGARSGALTPQQWGMLSFLLSEVAFFGTLIAAYLTFLGQDQSGPTPAVLSLPLVIGTTICLLSSSGTIHIAESRLRAGDRGKFLAWWTATIVLGVTFLAGTAYEWHGADYGARFDDQSQSLRHHVLHARGVPRAARHTGCVRDVNHARSRRPRLSDCPESRGCWARGLVLAFCRRGVGRRIHSRVLGWQVSKWIPTK